MGHPKLTVIVPVYNGMPFLPETVESLLNQTYQNFRLLLIDDGSTDHSLDYLKSLTDVRIEVKQQKNLGLCESLNQAVAIIQSEFIARLDQDDLSLPFRLQEQMEFLEKHPDYDCVLSNISRISADGKDFGYYQMNSAEEISDYIPENYGCIVHSTICFRRQTFMELGGYRSYVYPVDDYDLLLRFWENSKVAVINKPLVKYRIHRKAGTFRTFQTMQLNTRYVTKMSEFRRTGKPEISIIEYIQTIDQTNFWGKFNRRFREWGMLCFRKAGLFIGEGQFLLGAMNLVAAIVLYPKFATKRLLVLNKAGKQ